MDDIYVYLVDIPGKSNEFVTPCFDGYTVYIDEKLSPTNRIKAYEHAIRHIEADDFLKEDVQKIEQNAHIII